MGGKRGKPTESVLTVVSAASIAIRKLGWVSGREAYDYGSVSTRDNVCRMLYPPFGDASNKGWKDWIESNDLTVSEYDTGLAAKAIEWVKSVDTSKSEYLHNLSLLAQLEYVTADKFGYLVSLISTYNKACERETERADKAAKAAAKGSKTYYGSPKVRSKGIKATCVGLNSFEGNYGVTTLVRFEAYADNSYSPLAWFASGDKTEDFEVGEDYTFDAMIKDHNDHEKYGKQTRINRLKVL